MTDTSPPGAGSPAGTAADTGVTPPSRRAAAPPAGLTGWAAVYSRTGSDGALEARAARAGRPVRRGRGPAGRRARRRRRSAGRAPGHRHVDDLRAGLGRGDAA